MAVTQSASYQSTVASTTHTCAFGFTATAGQDLLALVASNAIISTPAGWTRITPAYNGSSPMDIAMFRKTTTGSEANVVVTGSAPNTMSIRILQFDNLGATGASLVGTASVSSANVQAAPITLSADGCALVLVAWSNTTATIGTTWAAPFGNSLRQVASGGSEPIVMTTALATAVNGETLNPTTSPGLDGVQVQVVSVQLGTESVATVPVVSAGVGQSSIEPGATVTLTGSITNTGGSAIISHQWRQISGPIAVLSASNTATTTYKILSCPADATAVFGYSAENAVGVSTEATVSHTVLHSTEQMSSNGSRQGIIFHAI